MDAEVWLRPAGSHCWSTYPFVSGFLSWEDTLSREPRRIAVARVGKTKYRKARRHARTSGDTLMDLHLHPVGEDDISVEVIDSAGVELGLLCSDEQVLLGGTRNLAADRLKGKNRRWAASPPSSLVAEGTTKPLVRAGEVEIPGFLPTSSHRDAGEGDFPLQTPSQHGQEPSVCMAHPISCSFQPPGSRQVCPQRVSSIPVGRDPRWCHTQGHLRSQPYPLLAKPLVLQGRASLGSAPQGEGVSHGDGDGDRLLGDGDGCGKTGQGDGNNPGGERGGLLPVGLQEGTPCTQPRGIWKKGVLGLPCPGEATGLFGVVSWGPKARVAARGGHPGPPLPPPPPPGAAAYLPASLRRRLLPGLSGRRPGPRRLLSRGSGSSSTCGGRDGSARSSGGRLGPVRGGVGPSSGLRAPGRGLGGLPPGGVGPRPRTHPPPGEGPAGPALPRPPGPPRCHSRTARGGAGGGRGWPSARPGTARPAPTGERREALLARVPGLPGPPLTTGVLAPSPRVPSPPCPRVSSPHPHSSSPLPLRMDILAPSPWVSSPHPHSCPHLHPHGCPHSIPTALFSPTPRCPHPIPMSVLTSSPPPPPPLLSSPQPSSPFSPLPPSPPPLHPTPHGRPHLSPGGCSPKAHGGATALLPLLRWAGRNPAGLLPPRNPRRLGRASRGPLGEVVLDQPAQRLHKPLWEVAELSHGWGWPAAAGEMRWR